MKKLKIELALVTIYLFFTIGVWIYSIFFEHCTPQGFLCGVEKIVPSIPAIFLFAGVINSSNDKVFYIFYILSILINIILFYVVGWLISLLMKKVKVFCYSKLH